MAERNESLNLKKITLTELVGICAPLAELVSDIFGPSGDQALMTSVTGKTVITRDGFSMLRALHVSHPMAQFIIRSLNQYHAVTEDGSKTYIIYLAELLKQISDWTLTANMTCQTTSSEFSSKLDNFLRTDFLDIVELCTEKLGVCKTTRQAAAKNVLKTCLHTCLPIQKAHFLADILWTFLSCDVCESTIDCLPEVLEHFDNYLVKVINQPLETSTVFGGMLFQCGINTLWCSPKSAVCARLVLVGICFDECPKSGGTSSVFTPSSDDSMSESFFQKRKMISCFLQQLKMINVDIILAVENVPKFVLSLCTEAGILLIQNVDDIRMNHIQEITGVYVLRELHNEPVEADVATINCQRIEIGTSSYLLIKPSMTAKAHPLGLKQIALCAPTDGLYDQVYMSLRKSLKALHACFVSTTFGGFRPLDTMATPDYSFQYPHATSSFESPAPAKAFLVVGGGGMFEALLSSTIHHYYGEKKKQGFMCENYPIGVLVQKMLASVPQKLWINLSASYNTDQPLARKWTQLLSVSRQLYQCGLDDCEVKDTNVGDIPGSRTVEPVVFKLLCVSRVLQLVWQLLQVETVVTVTGVSESKSTNKNRQAVIQPMSEQH